MRTIWVVMGFALALASTSTSEASNIYGTYNHPDLKWFSMETEHFVIYYHQGKSSSEWTARRLASFADEVYDNVTDQYEYKFDNKIHLVVRDSEEIANGWAIASQDWMTIWGTHLYTFTRGRSDWLKNVFHHEFGHIVSIKAVNPLGLVGKYFPGVFMPGLVEVSQDLGSENNAPDQLVSSIPVDAGLVLFVPSEIVPPWFAEGIAQYNATVAGWESWDSHRDMLLRMAVLEDSLLTMDEMNTFTGKVSLEMELVYNQGFSFIQFLAEKYGKDAEARLAKSQGKRWRLNFDGNFPKEFNETRYSLYNDWVDSLRAEYGKLQDRVKANEFVGEKVDFFAKAGQEPKPMPEYKRLRYKNEGLLNRFVSLSSDGRYTAFLSSRGSDRWGTTLYLCDNQKPGGERCDEVEDANANSQIAFSPDSKQIAFTQDIEDSEGQLNEIFFYDIEKKEISMMSGGKRLLSFWMGGWKREDGRPPFRASDLDWSPDGRWIVYTENLDGQKNLRIVKPDGTGRMRITNFRDGTQIGGPKWSPDGKSLLFYMYHDAQQDLWLLDMRTLKMKPLTHDKADDRDPLFTPDGSKVIFASDRAGEVFNLFELDLSTSRLTQLTNVVGGAFWPALTPDAKSIYYSHYTSYGYRFFEIGRDATYGAGLGAIQVPTLEIARDETKEETAELSELEARPATMRLRPFSLIPQIALFNQQAQLGLSLDVGDFLDQHSVGVSGLLGVPNLDQQYGAYYSNHSFAATWTIGYDHFLNNGEINLGTLGKPERDVLGDTAEISVGYPLRPEHWLFGGFLFRNIAEQFGSLKSPVPTLDFLLAARARFINLPVSYGCATLTDLLDYGPGPRVDCIGNNHNPVRNTQFNLGYEFAPSTGDIEADANRRTGRRFSLTGVFTQTTLSDFEKSSNEIENARSVEGEGGKPGKKPALPTDDYTFRRIILDYTEYFRSPVRYISKDLDRLSHSVYFQFYAGAQDKPVANDDKFIAGGRLNLFSDRLVSPFRDFPGYEGGRISGDALLMATLGYGFPIARRIHSQFGPFYLDSLFGKVFADIGNGFDMTGNGPIIGDINFDRDNDGKFGSGDLLKDVGGEIRAKLELFHGEGSWHSFIRIAKGLDDVPGLTRDVDDPNDPAAFGLLPTSKSVAKSEATLRVYFGLGTSF